VGWASADRPGQVFPLGSTFDPESDTLRSALDSALTSLYGLAVAVTPDTGRFAGVVAARNILDQVADARIAVAESISVRDAEGAMRRPVPQSAPDKAEKSRPADSDEDRDAKAGANKSDDVETSAPVAETAASPTDEPKDEPKAQAEGGDPKTNSKASTPEAVAASAADSAPTESVDSSSEPAEGQPEPDAAVDREATIVTVVSGRPVDLGKAEAAATPRDDAEGGAPAADDKPAGDEPVAAAERESEQDPVR
jgi:osmoprotectant transport system ATP-binding protein